MASDIVKGRTLPDLGWTTWNLLATTYWSLNLADCLNCSDAMRGSDGPCVVFAGAAGLQP